MPRSTNITEMQAKLARYDERTKEAAAALSKLEESRNALKAKIDGEERKARTHNLWIGNPLLDKITPNKKLL